MSKTFYTERDIDDLYGRGVMTLEVSDAVVLTDLARERAFKLGLRLVKANPTHVEDRAQAELIHRVKAAVLARLGDQVEEKVLEAVIAKVIAGLN